MSIKQNLLSAYRLMSFMQSERAWRSLFAKADFKVESVIDAKNILVVAPHPDDEIFGCGGTLLKAKKSNITILNIFAGDKNPGSEKAKIRRRESEKAAKKLLAVSCELLALGIADNSVIPRRVINEISNIINEKKPEIIFLPSPTDPHIDHRNTTDAVLRLISSYRHSERSEESKKTRSFTKVQDDIQVWFYEIWSPLPYFNRLIEIDSIKKTELMQIFESQLKDRNYISAINHLNSYRGEIYGLKKSAEAFMAVPADIYKR